VSPKLEELKALYLSVVQFFILLQLYPIIGVRAAPVVSIFLSYDAHRKTRLE
jgi:hypothetical protein